MSRSRYAGFSLVELAVSLVVIGLILGGVLSGRSMVRAAQLQSVGKEYQTILAAGSKFIQQYEALPGDMANATYFWGKDDSACSGNPGTAASPGTCNGDGNNVISDSAVAVSTTAEKFQFWKQLSLSEFIDGAYSGISGPTSATYFGVGVNVYPSKVKKAGWNIVTQETNGGTSQSFAMSYGHRLFFASFEASGNNVSAALTPTEAKNIDEKFDDGNPTNGTIIAVFWNNQCTEPVSGAVTNTNLNVRYRVTDSTERCALSFRRTYEQLKQ